ncbi:MAG: iron-containing alcohol dehydrogenase [Pleurocapsa minor GSE-CHR-MK-17-07R]|jgi:alcohol dehydrogenase class IV|nr:iron-containing alcohol dehydrogenase [Pleurocapsa minor GSE-CHR-MK 17-07R]
MRFEFATATRIYFGAGAASELGKIAASFGTNVMLVAGSAKRAAPMTTLLESAGLKVTVQLSSGEPTIEAAESASARAREAGIEVVVGVGGGSALDLAKAIGALAVHDGVALDYLEVIGRGKPLTKPSLPVIAVPTTSGTGSEVTANAVLSSAENRVKVSLRSASMLPRAAIVDPLLTVEMPPNITAYTGMDALTQCIEPYVSNKANPLTDAIAREGIVRASRSLEAAFANGANEQAREDMSLAALFGGLSLANAKLGAVHGFAAVIGGMFEAPHGAICACLLPHVMVANISALQAREPQSDKLSRYGEIARLVTGDSAAVAQDGAQWVHELTRRLDIPPLREFNVQETDIEVIAQKSAGASSMQGNPVKLTHEELVAILKAAR